jgi:hypothetical protein
MVDMVDVIDQAAADIEQYGWRNGPATGGDEYDANGTYPRCVWIGVLRASEKLTYEMGPYQESFTDIEYELFDHFQVGSPAELFELNDSQPPEEGQEWAVENLRTLATNLRNGVGAASRLREKDSGSTE